MTSLKIVLPMVFMICATPIGALPLPPPPADRLALEKQFFRALPKRVPIEDLKAFAPYVSKDVKVYRGRDLAFSSRDEWFGFLQSFGPKGDNAPRGLSISREEFFATRDGEITVLEFWFPIPPKGQEGQISYHQDYDFQLVTYRLQQGILTEVEYSKRLRRYDDLLEQ